MRLLILAPSDHLYANHIITHLIQTRDVAAVWESGVLLHGKSFPSALQRYWLTSGPDYVVSQAIKQWIFKLGARLTAATGRGQPGDLFFSYRRLANLRGVPISVVHDANSDEAHQHLRDITPDLIVSVYFNQILKPSTIALAPLGCINGHPAPLPRYRGVSPVFWALANGESEAGFTVHEIDAGIDTGRLLAQTIVPIEPQDTEHSLYWRLTRASLPLFDLTLDRIAEGQVTPLDAPQNEPTYFSLPTREAVKRFRQRRRRFFRSNELVGGG